MEARDKPVEFRLERKGCEAAEDQASNKDCEPKANATKMVRLRHV
jgi:hypothetical protein